MRKFLGVELIGKSIKRRGRPNNLFLRIRKNVQRGITKTYRTIRRRKLSDRAMRMAREKKLEHIEYRDNPCADRIEYVEDVMKIKNEKLRRKKIEMLKGFRPELKEGEITEASIIYWADGVRDCAIVKIKNKEKPLVVFFDEKGKVKKK